jgi:VCBS repeat-containing protein
MAALKASLQASIQAALAVQLHADETLLPPLCTPTVSANPAVGEEASQLRVTVEETCTGLAYSTQALHDLVTQVVTQQASRQWGTGYALAGRVQARIVKSTSEGGQPGSLTLQVTGRGAWVYQFTQAQLHHLATLIAGKSTREAKTILLGVAGVQSVTIQLHGADLGTSSTLPGNPAQIKMGELIGL